MLKHLCLLVALAAPGGCALYGDESAGEHGIAVEKLQAADARIGIVTVERSPSALSNVCALRRMAGSR